jgi:hypothetical protein
MKYTPAFRDPASRVAPMDEQGMECGLMVPANELEGLDDAAVITTVGGSLATLMNVADPVAT